MFNEIIYSPQSQGESRSNQFSLTTEQVRILSLMMPAGYCIVPKSKVTVIQPRVRQNIPPINPIRKERKPEPRTEIYEPAKPAAVVAPPTRALSSDMQKCLRILTKVQRHESAYPFELPVDTTVITDYLTIVKEPMDLSTIKKNIINGVYNTVTEFAVDLRRVWTNAYAYNPPRTAIYDMAVAMERYSNRLLQEEGIPVIGQPPSEPSTVSYEKLLIQKPVVQRQDPIPKKKTVLINSLSQTPMTMQEKRSLGQMIKKLPHEYLRGVWEIVNDSQQNRQELEFDIETLPIKKARQLESYVKNIFNNLETKKLKEVTNKQHLDQASENESSFIIDSDDS